MQRSELLATVERLSDTELDLLERDELATVVAASARLRGWLDTFDLRCSRRVRNLADAGHAEPAASMLARNGNRTSRDAIQIDRREKVAEAMPSLEDGLSTGAVSAGHLDAIANATRHSQPEIRAAFAVHEEELAAFAARESISSFTRRCRALVTQLTTEVTGNDATELDRQRADSRIRTWLDAETGMHHTHTELDPLRNEMLWNAINRSVRRRQQRDGNARTPWNQMQVDGLIDAVQGGATEPPGAPTRRSPHPRETAPEPAPATGPATGSRRPGVGVGAGSSIGPSAGSVSKPPTPVAGIAQDLADAIDRDFAAHGHVPHEPDRWWNDHSPGDGNDHLGPDIELGLQGDPQGEPQGDRSDDASPGSDLGFSADGDKSEQVLRRIEQRIPEISALVDLTMLTGDEHPDGICETEDGVALPVSTIRRLCCDAEIFRIVLDADGVPLDLGRSVRTVNRGQRRALCAMHRTCAHPDCDVPFSHTKIHHVRWWMRDRGPTDIDNLLPLCERHHHLVHEGRWGLTMTPDRVATWTRPDGTIHHLGSTIDRRGDSHLRAPRSAPVACRASSP